MSTLRADNINSLSDASVVPVTGIQLVNEAYVNVGVYAPGIQLNTYQSTVTKDGVEYRPLSTTVLPYTTTGTWLTDEPFFSAVGDSTLRGDLASSTGTDYISRGVETLEQSLIGIESDITNLPASLVQRYSTKAAFDSSANSGSNARVLEGTTASGDGSAGLYVKRAGDSVSPVDGYRAIDVPSGGRWRSVVNQQGAEVTMPGGFPFVPAIKPIKTRSGYAGHIDARDLAPAVVGTNYYVDVQTGNDANPGTDVSPLKTMQAALGKPDVATIRVAPGFYHRLEGWGSVYPAARNFIVERWEGVRHGPVIMSTAEAGLTWTVNGTYSNVYQANRTLVSDVRDYSRYVANTNTPYRYRKVASLAICATVQGSYYTDGTVVYLNTLEGGSPRDHVKVVLNVACGYFNSQNTVYVEGIEFHGGREAFYPQNTALTGGSFIAKNCRFLLGVDGTYGNGIRLEGVNLCVLQDCEATLNTRDGFNYHESGPTGVRPYVVEINCTALYNGQEGNTDSINNASTMHDGGAIVRIGGRYGYSEGPNVVDVGTSQTVNIGSYSFNSRVGGTAINNAGFYVSDGNMWLYDCESVGNYYDAVQTGTGVMYACLTPLRRTNVAETYYVQPVGDILA